MYKNYISRISLILLLAVLFCGKSSAQTKGVYYVLEVYHYKTQQQENRLDNYFKNAYVPALHKAGMKLVGVFKTLEADTASKCFYVLETYKTLKQRDVVRYKVLSSAEYQLAGKDFED